MQYAGRVIRWLGITLAAVLFLLVAVFGLLQTQIGKGWLETEIARAASSPDFTVSMGGLGGVVPFRMTVRRIDIGDRDGSGTLRRL
jgi:autotransporter translocation and assembly factor TamB